MRTFFSAGWVKPGCRACSIRRTLTLKHKGTPRRNRSVSFKGKKGLRAPESKVGKLKKPKIKS